MMRETIKAQIAEPGNRNADHVKRSLIWNTTTSIKKIQAQLVAGYTFDKDALEDMVRAMFEFINGIVGDARAEGMEVKDEKIVAD